MKNERNALLRDALPELQQFAMSMGSQAQLVDLRWGVSEEVTIDPEVGAVHLEQLRLCLRYSCGPNFVVSNSIAVVIVTYSRTAMINIFTFVRGRYCNPSCLLVGWFVCWCVR